MFSKILVANRGEIAVRAFRAAYELGAKTVAVFPYEDRNSIHRQKADEAYRISQDPLSGYLNDLCASLRRNRAGGWLPLRIVKQGEADHIFMKLLVEDQTRQMMAYPEFLTHCHRYILSKVA